MRKLLSVDFPNKSVLSSVVLADVRLDAGPSGSGLTLGTTPDILCILAPYGTARPGWYRSTTWDRRNQVPDSAPRRGAGAPATTCPA